MTKHSVHGNNSSPKGEVSPMCPEGSVTYVSVHSESHIDDL